MTKVLVILSKENESVCQLLSGLKSYLYWTPLCTGLLSGLDLSLHWTSLVKTSLWLDFSVNWTTLGELDSSLYWTPLFTGLLSGLDFSVNWTPLYTWIPLWTGFLFGLDFSLHWTYPCMLGVHNTILHHHSFISQTSTEMSLHSCSLYRDHQNLFMFEYFFSIYNILNLIWSVFDMI